MLPTLPGCLAVLLPVAVWMQAHGPVAEGRTRPGADVGRRPLWANPTASKVDFHVRGVGDRRDGSRGPLV